MLLPAFMYSTNMVPKINYSMGHFTKLLNSATSNPGNGIGIHLVSASEVPEERNYIF